MSSISVGATAQQVSVEQLKKKGYEVVEGADVGDIPHMRLIRERGGDTCILVGTPHGRGPRQWTLVWTGSSARGLDEWATRVGQPAMDVVAAEVAARNARTRKPVVVLDPPSSVVHVETEVEA